MLKYAFLAGAMTLSAPLFAQDAPARDMTPQTTQPAPTTTDQTAPTQPMQPVPQSPAPADSVVTPAQDSATAPAQSPAATTQPASATQVADVVSKEFATYDTDGDGVLNAKEFDNWMVALKTASDPATKANSPATKTWLSEAFAQADTDKNQQVSKAELTGFLSQQG